MTHDEVIFGLAQLKSGILAIGPDNIKLRKALERAIEIITDSRDYEDDVRWMTAPLTLEEQCAVNACCRPGHEIQYDPALGMYVIGED